MTAAGFDLPGGESTSSQLRRIAQERTQLAVALREEKTARAATQADLTQAIKMRDLALTGLALTRAELVSARQEIERLKAGGAS